MKNQSLFLSALATILVAVDNVKACTDLIITGLFDTPTPSRGIELYAPCDISDLSKYGIGRANNGANSNGQEFKFPAGTTVAAGSFIYVGQDAGYFTTFILDPPDYTVSTVANNNGVDVLELFRDEVVIDTYGVIGTDGTGTAWEFSDGWAYRKDNSKPSSTFTESQWDFSGKDALDGHTVNRIFTWSGAKKIFPDGSFTCNVDLCNTAAPSNVPSDSPSAIPSISIAPSESPSTSIAPSTSPSVSAVPTEVPSSSMVPSASPSTSIAPTKSPKATKAPASTKAPAVTKAPTVNVRK